MFVKVSGEADVHIRAHGGRIWVSPSHHRCCTGLLTLLNCSISAPVTPESFVETACNEVTVMLSPRLRALPDEMEIRLRGWRHKQLEALWNGCVWVD